MSPKLAEQNAKMSDHAIAFYERDPMQLCQIAQKLFEYVQQTYKGGITTTIKLAIKLTVKLKLKIIAAATSSCNKT